MKKFNALTLAAIFSVSVVVVLSGYIATRPIAGDLGGSQPSPATMTVPF